MDVFVCVSWMCFFFLRVSGVLLKCDAFFPCPSSSLSLSCSGGNDPSYMYRLIIEEYDPDDHVLKG